MTTPPTSDSPFGEYDPFDGQGWESTGQISSGSSASAGREPESSSGRRRVRVRKRVNRRRRRLIYIGLGVAGLLLVGVGWVLYSGFAARSQLETVRDEVHELRTDISQGNLDGARATAEQITAHAHKAHELTTGPVWRLAAMLPWVGSPVGSARTIAESVNSIAGDALPTLVNASKQLDPKALRGANGTINLAPLVAETPTLNRAVNVMNLALLHLTKADPSTWLGSVNSARASAISELTPLTKTITAADTAANVLPPMLGNTGPKYYMVSFENEAELRGTGGLPGAFAIVEADHGKISFTKFEADTTLDNVKSGLNLGTDFDETYDAADVTGDYRDANTSPNFPYAAQIWLAEWKVTTGQQLDGAITLDPTALSYLLAVTGPATMADKTVVNSDNVVQLTQQTIYARYANPGDNAQRKQFLLELARAVSQKLQTKQGGSTALVRAAGKAAGEYRLLVWSADPDVEARLATTSISGVVPDTTATYGAIAINNRGANKLDYYLHASMTWRATGCGSTRQVTVTVTLHNESPADLPKYVLGFTGQPGFPKNPGDNALEVTYYGTDGGVLDSVLINGNQTTASTGREIGHPVYGVLVPIARGSTQTLEFNLTEPGTGVPTLRLQPMVNPMTGSASAQSCG